MNNFMEFKIGDVVKFRHPGPGGDAAYVIVWISSEAGVVDLLAVDGSRRITFCEGVYKC